MKLKTIKLTSLIFLVLSFHSIQAADTQELTADGCLDEDTTYQQYSGEQRAKCDPFISQYKKKDSTDDDKVRLKKNFNNQAGTAKKLAEEKGIKDAASLSTAPYCKDKNGNIKTKFQEPANEGAESAKNYGSRGLQSCDGLALGQMKTLYKNGNRNSSFDWMEYINYSCRDKCSTTKDEQSDKPGDPFENCVTQKKAIVKSCESVAFVMNSYGRDWSDTDQFKVVKAGGSSGAAKVSGSTNGNAATTTVGASSINCLSEGIETVDYEPCKKFQVQLDLIEGVQQIGYQAQTLVYSDKMMDSQQKFATEQNAATGALKATGESLRMQQDMMNQRSAIEATKLAYAYTLYTDMPRTSEIADRCKDFAGRPIESIKEAATIDQCKSAVGTGKGFALAMNQQALEAMRSKLIQIATATGSNMLLASLLGKRADDVNKAIAKIDDFKPIDPYTTSEADAQSTFCKMNPGAAQCLTGGLERTFDTMNDNVITFGDGATGTSYGAVGADGTSTAAGATDATARKPVGPVGSIIASAAQDNSMEKSDAAKVTTSGTGASGGGGGGSGGGASGGGSGGAAPGAGTPGGVAAAIQGKTPTYGGGSGSFSVMGGFGINKKKGDGKDEGNPFGKLFGKDGAKDNTLNFRDIASQKVGSKGDNLFDMISKRYTSVNADKRLLEYELAK